MDAVNIYLNEIKKFYIIFIIILIDKLKYI